MIYRDRLAQPTAPARTDKLARWSLSHPSLYILTTFIMIYRDNLAEPTAASRTDTNSVDEVYLPSCILTTFGLNIAAKHFKKTELCRRVTGVIRVDEGLFYVPPGLVAVLSGRCNLE